MPNVRDDDEFFRIPVKPGPPPRIAAVGNNMMGGERHQAHVIEGVPAGLLKIHESEFGTLEVGAAPSDVVGEDPERGLAQLVFGAGHGAVEVRRRADGEILVVDEITAADMDGDGVFIGNLPGGFRGFLIHRHFTEIDLLLKDGAHLREEQRALEVADEQGVVRKFLKSRIKRAVMRIFPIDGAGGEFGGMFSSGHPHGGADPEWKTPDRGAQGKALHHASLGPISRPEP